MLTEKHINIREATSKEDLLIAKHSYQMWLDIGVDETNILLEWQNITLKFIEEARRDLFYKAFIAEADNTVVGSVSCQLFAGLYPNVFKDEYRKFGYIWGVYVEQSYRRQGIAKTLTNRATEYLKAIGCTRVVLNASPLGKPVYSSLGFSEGNLMQLEVV